ncbi:hypothetical protein JTB14_022326 [Gonioctena quinquepunctata]|nr:hypothetical protein JTB14_022326 [Gonioctena quinquepunctata]
MNSENNESITRLKNLEESVVKINGAMKSFSSEVDGIKNNLQMISEIMTKFVSESRDLEGGKYKVFGKFVEESLERMSQGDAESAVLEIVDVLHKHNINCGI